MFVVTQRVSLRKTSPLRQAYHCLLLAVVARMQLSKTMRMRICEPSQHLIWHLNAPPRLFFLLTSTGPNKLHSVLRSAVLVLSTVTVETCRSGSIVEQLCNSEYHPLYYRPTLLTRPM